MISLPPHKKWDGSHKIFTAFPSSDTRGSSGSGILLLSKVPARGILEVKQVSRQNSPSGKRIPHKLMKNNPKTDHYLDKFTGRKIQMGVNPKSESLPDSLAAWIKCYLRLAVIGVRSEEVAQKIALHLSRFQDFFVESYGHDRLSTCLRRDVLAWQTQLLSQGLAHSTINNHLASLSAFTTWVHTHNPDLFSVGDPAKGIGELGLPPLEPRALNPDQVRQGLTPRTLQRI